MKKLLLTLLLVIIALFSMAACGEDNIAENAEGSEITIYANGGTIWVQAEEPYEMELGTTFMEVGSTFADSFGEGSEIDSITKDGYEFDGWTIYAVSKGSWISEEATDLKKGQLCVECGDYGYYLMDKYEILNESAATEELGTYTCDGRNYYIIANWK